MISLGLPWVQVVYGPTAAGAPVIQTKYLWTQQRATKPEPEAVARRPHPSRQAGHTLPRPRFREGVRSTLKRVLGLRSELLKCRTQTYKKENRLWASETQAFSARCSTWFRACRVTALSGEGPSVLDGAAASLLTLLGRVLQLESPCPTQKAELPSVPFLSASGLGAWGLSNKPPPLRGSW